MGVTALLLLVSDFRYHWENRRILLGGFVFALFLALPLIIFLIREPNANAEQLRTVNSYLAQDIPISQKIGLYLQKYLYGLSPQYWLPYTFEFSETGIITGFNFRLDKSAWKSGKKWRPVAKKRCSQRNPSWNKLRVRS
jgi:hypothetical protein